MSKVVQLFVILCCLVKLTLASLSCTARNSTSICTDDRRQGGIVYVDFSLAPLYVNNTSCSCFIFAQSDTEILTSYETSSDSDIILVNTSLRLGDQTFKEASKGFIQLSANSSKKLQFNGDIDKQSPGVCLRFNSSQGSTQGNIEVVCLISNDTTVPTSVFATTTKTTTGTTSDTSKQSTFETTKQPTFKTSKQPTFKTTKQPTSNATEQSTSSAAEQSTTSTAEQSTPILAEQSTSDKSELSQYGGHQGRTNDIIIGGAIGGGFLVIVLVIEVTVIMCQRRRLSASQNKEQPKIQTIASQDEENLYNVENALYISADYDIRPSGNRAYADTFLTGYDVTHDKTKTTHEVSKQSSENEDYYDQPDQCNPKQDVENMSRSINEYSVVFTNKKNTPSVDDTDTYDHVNRV